MKAERNRLKRLQRLEKVRDIAKQSAAAEAARAEGTLAQLLALSERTQKLADSYARRDDATDAASLRQLNSFAMGLQQIAGDTAGDANVARTNADRKLAALASAEMSRSAVEERAQRQARVIAKKGEVPSLGSRRGFGTDIE